jgi:hypothetical protein
MCAPPTTSRQPNAEETAIFNFLRELLARKAPEYENRAPSEAAAICIKGLFSERKSQS